MPSDVDLFDHVSLLLITGARVKKKIGSKRYNISFTRGGRYLGSGVGQLDFRQFNSRVIF
jgi:hypothetical protein